MATLICTECKQLGFIIDDHERGNSVCTQCGTVCKEGIYEEHTNSYIDADFGDHKEDRDAIQSSWRLKKRKNKNGIVPSVFAQASVETVFRAITEKQEEEQKEAIKQRQIKERLSAVTKAKKHAYGPSAQLTEKERTDYTMQPKERIYNLLCAQVDTPLTKEQKKSFRNDAHRMCAAKNKQKKPKDEWKKKQSRTEKIKEVLHFVNGWAGPELRDEERQQIEQCMSSFLQHRHRGVNNKQAVAAAIWFESKRLDPSLDPAKLRKKILDASQVPEKIFTKKLAAINTVLHPRIKQGDNKRAREIKFQDIQTVTRRCCARMEIDDRHWPRIEQQLKLVEKDIQEGKKLLFSKDVETIACAVLFASLRHTGAMHKQGGGRITAGLIGKMCSRSPIVIRQACKPACMTTLSVHQACSI